MKKIYFLILTFCIFVFIAPLAVNAQSGSSILVAIEKLRLAIVEIEVRTPIKSPSLGVYKRTGAGLILDDNRTIVTNAHTVVTPGRITVKLYDDTQVNARLTWISKGNDIAFLRTAQEMPSVEVTFADSDKISFHEPIYTVGSSLYRKGTITSGTIVGMGRRGASQGARGLQNELIQVDFGVYKGDSGTPLFDKSGRLLGIMAFSESEAPGKTFAIPANKIRNEYIKYLKKIKGDTKSR